jgi:hypothetical protein
MAESTAEAPDEGRAPQTVTESDQWAKARTQQLLAVDGLAESQCTECGVYRLDGARPILHKRECSDRAWYLR